MSSDFIAQAICMARNGIGDAPGDTLLLRSTPKKGQKSKLAGWGAGRRCWRALRTGAASIGAFRFARFFPVNRNSLAPYAVSIFDVLSLMKIIQITTSPIASA